jgi:2-polyprenyl-6-methoxyphenol hydroxylase-like FAD-dependent oxidoreductase
MHAAPVLVAGAGPVGLAAALSLAQSGIAVRIIDKLAEPTNQSRAAVIHSRTLEMLERLGVVERFLAIGVKIHGAVLHGPGGAVLTRPNMDHLPSHYNYMLGVDQCTTERLLTEQLHALGVSVERSVELISFEQADSAVSVKLKLADGSETTESFSYLVGTDGARSAVRHTLGLELEGETLDATWITADVKIRWDRPPDEAIVYLSREGIAFIAAMNGDRWRVIVNVEKISREEAEKVTLEDVQEIVTKRFGIEAPLYDPVWVSPFSINTRMAPTMRVGRVFLAGDASHVHSPLGGQGMNTGIQDSLNLAWKLALVLKGKASEALLDSYNPERHENAKQLLSKVGPATKMINLRQPAVVEIRNMVIRTLGQLGITAVIARTFSMLEIAYPHSPAVEDHRAGWLDRGVHAGHRAPDSEGLLYGDDTPRRLYELWEGDARHQLLLFSGHKPQPEQLIALAEFASELAELDDFLRIILIVDEGHVPGAAVDSTGGAHDAYGATGSSCVLVRPDGYIAYRGPATELAVLRAYLAKWYPGAKPA